MKVRLTIQLLSESVADALTFCEETLGLDNFRGCKATAYFIKMIINIFDILNSLSLAAPRYKKAIFDKNIERTRQFVFHAIEYLSTLKLTTGELVICPFFYLV